MVRGIVCLVGCFAALAAAADPIVIAHRGASGYLPEHTLEAYAMAYAQGADYIEPDLVMTKDDVFICLHDVHLEATTDVEQKFPKRRRADGQWYAIDFTLSEIKTLNVHERLENRFPVAASDFEVPTFAEMVELIQGMNAVTGRDVGIYPELKAPSFHAEQGHAMVPAILNVLAKFGYTAADSPVYLQCFEPDTVKLLRNEHKTPLKLIQLIGDDDRFAPLRTEAGIDAISEYADGIGPFKGDLDRIPAMAEWARARNLAIHPYTFRADDVGEGYATFEAELRRYTVELGVDGLFTDHPDRVIGYLNQTKETD